MVRVDDEMGREVYSLLLLVPGGLRFFSRAVLSTAREKDFSQRPQRLSGEIDKEFIKIDMQCLNHIHA